VLTVLADTNPPAIMHIVNLGLTNVQIVYPKPLKRRARQTWRTIFFTNGLPVTGAVLGGDNQTVNLTTAAAKRTGAITGS